MSRTHQRRLSQLGLNRLPRINNDEDDALDAPRFLYTLSNGLQILLVPTGKGDLVHVQLDVATGSDDEIDPRDYESAHVLEHMLATFTSQKRPRGIEVQASLDDRGIVFNANVRTQRSRYFVRGRSEDLPFMLDVLLDSYADYRFDTERYAQEQRAVEQELRAILNKRWYPLEQRARELLYPLGHPRAVSETKHLANVARLTRDDLLRFRNAHYATENTTITIAGAIDANKVREYVERKLGTLPRSQRARPVLKSTDKRKPTIVEYVPIRDVASTRLMFLWSVPLTNFSPQRHEVRAIEMMLADGFSSRLIRTLRVEQGLIYSIGATAALDERYPSLSVFQIDTTVDHTRIVDTAEQILSVVHALCRDGPSDAEMAKWRLRVQTLYAARALDQSPERYADDYSRFPLFGHPVETNEKQLDDALSVTADDIRTLCKRIFDNGRVLLVYGGPKDVNPQLQRLLITILDIR